MDMWVAGQSTVELAQRKLSAGGVMDQANDVTSMELRERTRSNLLGGS